MLHLMDFLYLCGRFRRLWKTAEDTKKSNAMDIDIIGKMPETHIFSFEFVLWAVLIGVFLSLVVNLGPAFITLIQTSLHHGFKSAAWFATGVLLNDTLIVAVCILTTVMTSWYSKFNVETPIFSICAGVVLILFGVFTFTKKAKEKRKLTEEKLEELVEVKEDKPFWLVFLGKGFALNILNPGVWVFWFTVVATISGNLYNPQADPTMNRMAIVLFFSILLATTLVMEYLKAWGAAKLKVFFNPKRLTIMNRITGILLMLFGLYFIVIEGIMKLI